MVRGIERASPKVVMLWCDSDNTVLRAISSTPSGVIDWVPLDANGRAPRWAVYPGSDAGANSEWATAFFSSPWRCHRIGKPSETSLPNAVLIAALGKFTTTIHLIASGIHKLARLQPRSVAYFGKVAQLFSAFRLCLPSLFSSGLSL